MGEMALPAGARIPVGIYIRVKVVAVIATPVLIEYDIWVRSIHYATTANQGCSIQVVNG